MEEEWIPQRADTRDVDPRLVEGRAETRRMVKEILSPTDAEGGRLPISPEVQIANMQLLSFNVAEQYLSDDTGDPVLDDRCRYIRTALDHLRDVNTPRVVAEGEARFRALRDSQQSSAVRPDASLQQRMQLPLGPSGPAVK